MKKILTVLFTLLLLLPCNAVKAESYPQIDTDFKVTFDGKALNGNYDAEALRKALEGMQPGDSADLEFTLVNSYKDGVDFYMSNEVLQSFEDDTKASGGAYTYQLIYTDSKGNETEIYSSKAVGGEGSSIEGLHGATDALTGYFLLENIPSGKTGKVTLHIELDGETQNNSYQDTLAKLQINFAVETPTEEIIRHKIPKTSTTGLFDKGEASVGRYFTVAGISFVLTLLFGILFLRSRREENA